MVAQQKQSLFSQGHGQPLHISHNQKKVERDIRRQQPWLAMQLEDTPDYLFTAHIESFFNELNL